MEEFARPAGVAAFSVPITPALSPALVLFVEGPTEASGSYREYIPDDAASFCYVPE